MTRLLALALALSGAPSAPGEQVAVFAGGCFWGIEAVFEHVKGVVSATSGYSGGTARSPSYEDVTAGGTGHAESVRVVFDPAKVSYAQLLEIFFSVAHDPTQLNRQGPDVGTQYRSAIYFVSEDQKRDAEAYVAQLANSKLFSQPIVTEITALRAFYPAEEYHQDFAQRHPLYPYIVIHDRPKVVHLKRQFPSLYREHTSADTRE